MYVFGHTGMRTFIMLHAWCRYMKRLINARSHLYLILEIRDQATAATVEQQELAWVLALCKYSQVQLGPHQTSALGQPPWDLHTAVLAHTPAGNHLRAKQLQSTVDSSQGNASCLAGSCAAAGAFEP